jgi:hypothetical protein
MALSARATTAGSATKQRRRAAAAKRRRRSAGVLAQRGVGAAGAQLVRLALSVERWSRYLLH